MHCRLTIGSDAVRIDSGSEGRAKVSVAGWWKVTRGYGVSGCAVGDALGAGGVDEVVAAVR